MHEFVFTPELLIGMLVIGVIVAIIVLAIMIRMHKNVHTADSAGSYVSQELDLTKKFDNFLYTTTYRIRKNPPPKRN